MAKSSLSALLLVAVALFGGLIESALVVPSFETITNAAEYEQFKSGQSLDPSTVYVIGDGAVPNAFDDVQTLATFDVATIIVYDEKGNHVTLTKSKKNVSAYLTQGGIGGGQMQLLPTDYTTYTLEVQALSLADIHAIEQWQSAEEIDILVESRLNDAVAARVAALSISKNIRVTISRFVKTTEDMQNFLASLP